MDAAISINVLLDISTLDPIFPSSFCTILSLKLNIRAPEKVRIFISVMNISSSNSMFNNLLESSHRDDSNTWSTMGFGEEIMQVVLIEVNFTQLIWSSGHAPPPVPLSDVCQTNR